MTIHSNRLTAIDQLRIRGGWYVGVAKVRNDELWIIKRGAGETTNLSEVSRS
jgi:hypothetical protein